ncbi:hypothetical protein LXA43DRAFT_875556, partial [Ganoderma leucocontextum]
SPATLLRLLRVCRGTQAAVNSHFRRAFNISKLLSHFFSEPPLFRSLQARTGTLISGSLALQFLQRSPMDPMPGLDIFAYMHYGREVGRWLRNNGYHFVPAIGQDENFAVAMFKATSVIPGGPYVLDGVASLFTFVRQSSERKDLQRTVKLIVSQSAPMEAILSSHSTCVMNAVSYETAYCLFPRATLEEKVTLVSCSTKGIYRNRSEALAKYGARGYTTLLCVPPHDFYATHPSFPLGWRWIDDNTSWVLNL